MTFNAPLPGATLSLTGALQSSGAFRPGQTYRGVVVNQQGNLFAVFGGARVPIAAAAGFAAGQPVLAQATETNGTLQLVLRTAPDAAARAQPSPAESGLLRTVLAQLGRLDRADRAAAIVPQSLPQSATAIRQLLGLFIQQNTVADDLQFLIQFTQQASAQGQLSPQLASQFAELAQFLSASEAQALHQLLRRLADDNRIEARLAAIAARGGAVSKDALPSGLRALLAQLLGDNAFTAFLRGRGAQEAVHDAVNRILERQDGGRLMQTHGGNQPYAFVELPIAANGPFRHGFLHFFEDGGAGQRDANVPNSVALDLNLTRLGDLWVQLSVFAGTCRCQFRVADEDARTAIDDARSTLEAALKETGYDAVQVTVGDWDGDRIGATANLLRRFHGMDVQG